MQALVREVHVIASTPVRLDRSRRSALPFVRVRAIRRFTVRPVLPEPLLPLGRARRQPAVVLAPARPRTSSSRRPETCGGGGQRPGPAARRGVRRAARARWRGRPTFLRAAARALRDDLEDYLTGDRWYQSARRRRRRASIAYFSPEFGITAVLPQYSGGLGILAGDHLKAASDLGVPIIGVGLLYRHGYFRQSLSREGWQQERYPVARPRRAAARRCCARPTARRRGSRIALPGGRSAASPSIWVAQVGRVPLLLLDSDIEENAAAAARRHRPAVRRRRPTTGCCRRCCSASAASARIRAYCRITGAPAPEVFHTNEGHAGFLGIERIRELIEADGLDFDAALEAARAGTVFTTHTPVPGRHRPVPARADRAALRRRQRRRRRAGRRDPRARRRGLRGRRPDGLQHGRDGPAAGAARQRREQAARRRQPRDVRRAVAGLRPDRGADHARSPTACTPRPGSPARSSSWPSARSAPSSSSTDSPRLGGRRRGPRRPRSGRPSATLRERLVDDVRAPAPRRRGCSAARARPSSAGSTTCSTPTC